MTRPVLLAGLLGGLLGAVLTFFANRWIVTPKPGDAGARAAVEGYVGLLKADRIDEFAAEAVYGKWPGDEQGAVAFRDKLVSDRKEFSAKFGASTGEFEFVRATTLSPSLARVVYLERYPRAGVLWVFNLYRGSDGWVINTVHWNSDLGLIFGGL